MAVCRWVSNEERLVIDYAAFATFEHEYSCEGVYIYALSMYPLKSISAEATAAVLQVSSRVLKGSLAPSGKPSMSVLLCERSRAKLRAKRQC